MSKRRRIVLIVLMAVILAVGCVKVRYRMMYPYGWSHCCIIQMSGALNQYAEENHGKYPADEATPEASLSLLYRSNYIDAYVLRGMTVPEKKVRAVLESGGLLGPDSCGWHYVPGLTLADDPGLALLWCKAALDHNGERTKDGGRQVVFLGRGIEWVSGEKWPSFLEEQKELMKQRSSRAVDGAPLVTGVIELPDGSRVSQLDASYLMSEESKQPDGSGSGGSSGSSLGRSQLEWYHAPIRDGYVTRTLSFSNLVSDSVKVTFTNGLPDKTNVVFKMRSKR